MLSSKAAQRRHCAQRIGFGLHFLDEDSAEAIGVLDGDLDGACGPAARIPAARAGGARGALWTPAAARQDGVLPPAARCPGTVTMDGPPAA